MNSINYSIIHPFSVSFVETIFSPLSHFSLLLALTYHLSIHSSYPNVSNRPLRLIFHSVVFFCVRFSTTILSDLVQAFDFKSNGMSNKYNANEKTHLFIREYGIKDKNEKIIHLHSQIAVVFHFLPFFVCLFPSILFNSFVIIYVSLYLIRRL